MRALKKQDKLFFAAGCLAPALLLYAALYLYPAVRVFVTSLFQWSGLSPRMQFIGLDNFAYLLRDKNVIKSFANTLKLIAFVPLPTLALSLLMAASLARSDLRERGFYRTVFFFPSVLSFVAVGILWSFVFHPTMGLLNRGLDALGLGALARPWLGDEKTVLPAIAFIMVWQAAGYYMVMYIAGIDGIPKELYEAAEIDGATRWQQLFRITVPMLWQVIRVTIVFIINGTVVISFTLVNVLTNGGPNWASEVALTQVYRQAFANANFGYAMSIAVVVFVFSLALSLLSDRLSRRDGGAAA